MGKVAYTDTTTGTLLCHECAHDVRAGGGRVKALDLKHAADCAYCGEEVGGES